MAIWIGRSWRRKCRLKHAFEGKIGRNDRSDAKRRKKI